MDFITVFSYMPIHPHDKKYFGNFMMILGLKGQKFWNAG